MVEDYQIAIRIDETSLRTALEKLQKVTKNMEVNLSPAKEKINDVNSRLSPIRQKVDEASRTLEPAREKIEESVQSVAEKKDEVQKQVGSKIEELKKPLMSMSKSALSLLGIGTGIGALVALITESSPLLKGMLTLLTKGIMLIFRPIGDFIAMLLRPLILKFMLDIAIPFYKVASPVMMKLGYWLGSGNWADDLLKAAGVKSGGEDEYKNWMKNSSTDVQSEYENVQGERSEFSEWTSMKIREIISGLEIWFGENIVVPIQNAWSKVVNFFESLTFEKITEAWDDLVNWFESLTLESITEAWDNFTGWIKGLLPESVVNAWNTLVGFIEGIGETINGYVGKAWIDFITWIHGVGTAASTWLTDRWEDVKTFFGHISNTLEELKKSWLSVIEWFADLEDSVKNTLKDIWDGIIATLVSIWVKIKNIFSSLNPFKSTSSSSSSSSSIASGFPDRVARQRARNKEYLSKRSAVGSVLTEPIVGFGQKTGDRYSFAEGGRPETVVQGIQPFGGGAGNLVINIKMLITQTADAMKVKEIVLNEIQKVYRQRGMV